MSKRLLIVLTIAQMLSSSRGSEEETKRVVCYYGGLLGKQIKYLYPEDIDASLCTHIVYIHGGINQKLDEVNITPLFGMSPTGGAGYAERLVKLKEANPDLKLLLFISPEDIPWVVKTAERRTKIIKSAIEFLNATRFDGLEIPTSTGEKEMEDLASFLCEMQAEFEKYGYTVSSAAPYNPVLRSLDPVVVRISRCCSFISIITIEDWNARTNTTRILAPMNVTKTAVETFIERGVPANKLLISIHTYGMIATLTDPKQAGLGSSIDGPGNNVTEYSDGYSIFYSQLSERLKDTAEGWTVVREEESNPPYAYSKTGLWTSYEDPTSAAAKARFVLEKNLGGAVISMLDMDDLEGITGKTFSISRAISDTLKQV